MLRRRCRLKSRAWGRTTSASWRSPTAPRPSSRSSPSGCSTPSTWTDAQSRRLLDFRCLTAIEADLKRACSVPALQHRNPKNTTWTVSSRSPCRAFYKPVPTGTTGRPCGICGRITTNRDFNFGDSGRRAVAGQSEPRFRQHALSSFWILHFVSKWRAVCFSCMAATARCRNTPGVV